MIRQFPGFDLVETLHEGARTSVYRGRRHADGRPVILKFGNAPQEGGNDPRLRHEYEILRGLSIPAVPQGVSLERRGDAAALVYDDDGGISLHRHCAGAAPDLPESLRIALRLAEALEQVHASGVLHKDVKPQNVIIRPRDGKILITDFSIATRLAAESALSLPARIEGTLAYISPEQTGRVARPVDHRSDLYSLGATLYELFTGRLVFPASDPMELVHAHIARAPQAPHEVRPSLPPMISTIVLKLLEKNADERYQSAAGVAFDLSECLDRRRRTGTIDGFAPARQDQSGRLIVPRKLYGRETEIARIHDAFRRAAGGSVEALFVTGAGGVGKSSLVRQLPEMVASRSGNFIEGKFEQFNRSVPYSALIDAFRDLVRRVLSESPEVVAQWKGAILQSVAPNGGVLTEVIPELSLLIGVQPEPPALPPGEARNRFGNAVRAFVRAAATSEHPLALFLDDLQWADASSIALLQHLAAEEESAALLIIGAYRDREVDARHPLALVLADMRERNRRISHLHLEPLVLRDIALLIADMLHARPEATRPLAERIREKTRGNPFFILEFLKRLHAAGIIRFNTAIRRWEWDLEAIAREAITENVAEFMTANIRRLPEPAVDVLRIAACIGGEFDAATLFLTAGRRVEECIDALWQCMEAGLILPLDHAYKYLSSGDPALSALEAQKTPVRFRFAHDRVRDAAESLLPGEERRSVHRRIGRRLAETLSVPELDSRLFEVVNHLNERDPEGETPAERLELARFNHRAGIRARAATAFAPALLYLRAARACLPGDPWNTQYDLAYAVFAALGEAEYVNGNFDAAEVLLSCVLANARTPMEKARILRIRIIQYSHTLEVRRAIESTVEALALLGIRIPLRPGIPHVLRALAGVRLRFLGIAVRDIIHLPPLEDERMMLAMSIMSDSFAVAFFWNREFLFLVASRMITITLKHGIAETAAYAFAQ